jgi:hypothetical protein
MFPIVVVIGGAFMADNLRSRQKALSKEYDSLIARYGSLIKEYDVLIEQTKFETERLKNIRMAKLGVSNTQVSKIDTPANSPTNHPHSSNIENIAGPSNNTFRWMHVAGDIWRESIYD